MHEYLLFGQVPAQRHEQVLNIFSGVTASPPTPFCDQHLIYYPLRATDSSNTVNTKRKPQNNTNQQRFLQRLHREVSKADSSETPSSAWKLLINETPEPGNQHMISRSTSDSDLKDHGQYRDESKFKYVGQQVYVGDQFVNGNVLCKVFRVFLPTKPQDQPLESRAPAMEQLRLFDQSGAYVVEASVRMEDRTNSKLTERASKELLDLKKTLQGAIELYVPDRLSLDTRIKDAQAASVK